MNSGTNYDIGPHSQRRTDLPELRDGILGMYYHLPDYKLTRANRNYSNSIKIKQKESKISASNTFFERF